MLDDHRDNRRCFICGKFAPVKPYHTTVACPQCDVTWALRPDLHVDSRIATNLESLRNSGHDLIDHSVVHMPSPA